MQDRQIVALRILWTMNQENSARLGFKNVVVSEAVKEATRDNGLFRAIVIAVDQALQAGE